MNRILLFLSLIFTKGDEIMAVVYATLIVKGKKTFDEVPDKLKDQVRQILIDLDCADLAD